MKNKILHFIIPFIWSISLLGQIEQPLDSISNELTKRNNWEELIRESQSDIEDLQNEFNQKSDFQDLKIELKKIKNEFEVIAKDSVAERYQEKNLWQLQTLLNRWETIEIKGSQLQIDVSELIVSTEKLKDASGEIKNKLEASIPNSDSTVQDSSLIQRVNVALQNASTLQNSISDTLKHFLKIEQEIQKSEETIQAQIAKLNQIIDQKGEFLFQKDQPGLLEVLANPNWSSESIFVSKVFAKLIETSRIYFKTHLLLVWVHILIILGLLIGLNLFKARLPELKSKISISLRKAKILIQNPIATTISIGLMLFFFIYPDPPIFIGQFVAFAVIPSIVIIISRLIAKRYQFFFYGLIFFYAFSTGQELFIENNSLIRVLDLVNATIQITFYSYYFFSKKSFINRRKTFLKNLEKSGIFLFLLFSVVALFSNFFGSVALSQIILHTLSTSAVTIVFLIITYMVFTSIVEIIIRSKWGKRSNIIRDYGIVLRNNIALFLRGYFIFIAIRSFLRALGVYFFFKKGLQDFLELGYTFGEITLTVGQLTYFLLILFVFSLLAKFLKIFLSEEILIRFDLKKGTPLAVGLVTRYFILFLGFLLAVAAMGVTLDKLNFILGAFGVGIGFGLQNIVGNFISGLILIFERPIHVGDIVVVDNVEGKVTEIGVRASKVRSWEGAEVVVPNMRFIGETVTNWTLSDNMRRKRVSFFTGPENNPQVVMDIITDVVTNHPEVEKRPEPIILNQGFKDFYYHYEVLFWVQGENIRISSKIATLVQQAFAKEGITEKPQFPFLKK